MKRFIAFVIAAAVLAGCGAQETTQDIISENQAEEGTSGEDISDMGEAEEISCSDIYDACVDSGLFDELVESDSEYMSYFGIDPENLEDFAAGEALDAASADTLVILKPKEGMGEEIKSELDSYLELKLEELENYNAEEFSKASACEVVSSGDYVYLVICSEPNDVEDIIEGMI